MLITSNLSELLIALDFDHLKNRLHIMLELINAAGRPIVCDLLLVTYCPTVAQSTQHCNREQIVEKPLREFYAC